MDSDHTATQNNAAMDPGVTTARPTLDVSELFGHYNTELRAAHERIEGMERAIAHERGQIEALERAALWLQQKLSPSTEA
jgi:hypothetical protein